MRLTEEKWYMRFKKFRQTVICKRSIWRQMQQQKIAYEINRGFIRQTHLYTTSCDVTSALLVLRVNQFSIDNVYVSMDKLYGNNNQFLFTFRFK